MYFALSKISSTFQTLNLDSLFSCQSTAMIANKRFTEKKRSNAMSLMMNEERQIVKLLVNAEGINL